MFADVVVNVPRLTSSYSYSIPEALSGRVALGHLVTVPFGSQRTQGIVTGLSDKPPALKQVSPIEGLIDPEPVLTPSPNRSGALDGATPIWPRRSTAWC